MTMFRCLNIPKTARSCKKGTALIFRFFLFTQKPYILHYRSSVQKQGIRLPQKQSFPPPPVSPRKRFFFLSIITLIPVLFFVALELVLRISGYGPDLRLFKEVTIGDTTYLIMNPSVKNRYFNEVDFAPTTSPEYFLPRKKDGTFRIFCLGGSTTVGYPYWYNGSFSSFLRDRLKALFPDRDIEIINLGMTATNSFTALDLAHDLIEYEPDLFLVYDGHNEFYGALGVASHEQAGTSRWMATLYLDLVHFRAFQFTRDIIRSVAGWFGQKEPAATRTGTMMEQMSKGHYIRYGDERYWEAYDTFKANLSDLCDLARNHRIPVIFGTQVSNIRDQSPFVSSSHASWDAARRQAFSANLARARTLVSESRVPPESDVFRYLLSQDSLHAESHFLYARYFESHGLFDSAKAHYVRARDYDELRFRTSSEFNRLILSLRNPGIVDVVDLEEAFGEASPFGLVGKDLMTEHLHPTSRGYFLIAKMFAHSLRSMNLIAPGEEWAVRDTIADDRLWDNRPLTELDELIAARRTEVLTSGWPFIDRYPIVDAVPEEDTLRWYAEQATRGHWDWKKAHEAAAALYERRGQLEKAAQEYRTIINQIPLSVNAYLRLARVQLDRNKIGEARIVLLRSLAVEETPLALRALGDIALRSGRAADAIRHYERLSRFPQDAKERSENGYLLSLAYLQNGNPGAAQQLLETLIREHSGNEEAKVLLQRIREVAAGSSTPR